MIGDTWPDKPEDYAAVGRPYLNPYKELDRAVANGIKITAIHLPTSTMDHKWWKAMPAESGGTYHDLYQFDEVLEAVTAVALNEGGSDLLAAFEQFLRQKGRYSRGVDVVFSTLFGRKTTVKKSALTPVDPHRFQKFTITRADCTETVKGVNKVPQNKYVESQGYKYVKGHGFYKLARTEKIQDYKVIIVMEKDTGDMYTGEDNIRILLHIPLNTSEVRLKDIDTECWDKYDIFVQSTAPNRRLIEGADFLLDIKDLPPL
jgi:hypothetical protein